MSEEAVAPIQVTKNRGHLLLQLSSVEDGREARGSRNAQETASPGLGAQIQGDIQNEEQENG